MSSDAAAKGPRRSVRIGKYEVLSHIASGGMGAVYKARDTEIGRIVAIKTLSAEMAASPGMLERFRREAIHAAKLSHENIVILHEFFENQQTHYLVMEFVEGTDLREYVNKKGPLDPKEALELIRQGCLALDHAHQHGVVHRDIKPSNFLITRQGDRMLVKLADFGLARAASNEEFRVTRTGTTIGTLDYMSPEQARDSGLADIRSDLYSLGGTWYYLLTGEPTFPKGGLGERLNQIMSEEPVNVRKKNPRVATAMAALVHRLLAKDPAKRPQTPADLLRDLDSLKRGEDLLSPRKALEILALDETDPYIPQPKKVPRAPEGRRKPPPAPGRARPESKGGKSTVEVAARSGKSTVEVPIADNTEPNRPYLWYGIGGAAAVVLLVSLTVFLAMRRSHRDGSIAELNTEQTNPANTSPFPGQIGLAPDAKAPNGKASGSSNSAENLDPDKKTGEGSSAPTLPKKTVWPALYRPSRPIDVAALGKEIEAPWAAASPSGPTVELIVGRLPPVPDKTFPSLAAACKVIPAGATGIIELRDNGPFFDVPVSLTDRNLVIRAAKGYQPLLVWDVQRMLDEQRKNRDRQPVFLGVKHGSLTLQDVHVAFKWPDAPSEKATVMLVEDGDLTVRNCTFSVAGKPRNDVTIARFLSTRPEAGRCRFERCYVRGNSMSVLDADAPGAQVLLEDCLFIGDNPPLLQARVAHDRPTRFRAVRSTMICDKNLLALRPASPRERDPAFEWLGWDVLLSRKAPEFGGELVRLDGISSKQLRWRAINCLYAGWSNLLAGMTSLAATDLKAWRRLWDRSEGDEVLADPWPRAVFPEPAELPFNTYRTVGSLVAFAASTDPTRPLGCDLDRLPPARDNWLPLSFDRFAIPATPVPDDPAPPEIPVGGEGIFHGARVDLNQNDLGLYLQTVQQNYRLAPEVVLHLTGEGERFMTPLHIKGSNLVLYFEPPEQKEEDRREPLILVAAGRGPAEALFDVEQGNLTILNGHIRFSDSANALVLPWLIRIRGGDLQLLRTHLEVPPKSSSIAFRGLIDLGGSGESTAERVHSCIASESVLVSARDALALNGIGARVLLAQSLLVAGEDAIRLTLDPDYTRKASESAPGVPPAGAIGKANVQCRLDHATVAARGSVVRLSDVAQTGPPTEPVIVQSQDCGFVNLFGGRVYRPSLVRYDGEALAHGLLIWQSDNDTFDRQIWYGAVSSESPLSDKPDDHTSWMGLWGSPALRRAKLDQNQTRTLGDDRWSVDQRLTGWRFPGANLEKLGLSRKSTSKTPR